MNLASCVQQLCKGVATIYNGAATLCNGVTSMNLPGITAKLAGITPWREIPAVEHGAKCWEWCQVTLSHRLDSCGGYTRIYWEMVEPDRTFTQGRCGYTKKY